MQLHHSLQEKLRGLLKRYQLKSEKMRIFDEALKFKSEEYIRVVGNLQ